MSETIAKQTSTRRALLPRDVTTITTKPREKKRHWAPLLFKNGRFSKLDGRSREAALLKDTTNALLDQLGRKPSAAEKLLLDRLSWLHLNITLLDQRVLSGNVSIDESIRYSTHIDAFSRGLVNLGLIGAVALPTLNGKERRTDELPSQDAQQSARSALRKREVIMQVDD